MAQDRSLKRRTRTMATSNIHRNVLVPSSLDMVELARAVEVRFLDLCDAYLRIRGEPLATPTALDRDMLGWRELRVRHRRGDMRNTEAEVRNVRTIAQWLVDTNCVLRNQPLKRIDWGDR